MSEQKKYEKIEDAIVDILDGELQENALNFVAYLNENQLTPRQSGKTDWKIPFDECFLCEIRFESNTWAFQFFDFRFDEYIGYIGECDDEFIAAVQEHVDFCKSCHDPCTSGKDTTIFGKEYKNVCSQLTKQFEDPNEKTLDYIKKLIEYSKKIAPHSEAYHCHNC